VDLPVPVGAMMSTPRPLTSTTAPWIEWMSYRASPTPAAPRAQLFIWP
jgi:hypothetical protein